MLWEAGIACHLLNSTKECVGILTGKGKGDESILKTTFLLMETLKPSNSRENGLLPPVSQARSASHSAESLTVGAHCFLCSSWSGLERTAPSASIPPQGCLPWRSWGALPGPFCLNALPSMPISEASLVMLLQL